MSSGFKFQVSNLKFQRAALIAVLLVGAWFRSFRLDSVPPGPHHDAIINGQIVQEFIWPALPAWLRPADASPFIPWLTLQANPNGPDLQEHAWLYQITLAASLGALGRNLLGMRFVDLAWGMLSLSACYALARRLFGRKVALVATMAQVVSFWVVIIGRAGLRTGTITPLLALAACAFWDAWRSLDQSALTPTPKNFYLLWKKPMLCFLLSGVLLGLSIYGYLAARPMVLAFLAFAVYLGLTRRVTWQRLLPGIAIFLATAALVATPHVLYLYSHPEENLRFNMLSGPLQELVAGRSATLVHSASATLGMFFWRGDPQWQYNVAGRPVFDPIGAFLFVVGIVLSVWRWRSPANTFALIWLLVSLTPGMLSLPAPHWLRTVAAQGVTFAFVGLGAVGVVCAAQRATSAWPSALVRVGMVAWLAAFAVWSYQGCFEIWARNDEVRFYYQGAITEAAHYLDHHVGTTPVAACSMFLNEREDFIRSPRQTFPFVLKRTDLAIRWFDCRDSFVIPAGGPARLMFPDVRPYSSTLDVALLPWMNTSVPVHDDGLPDGTLYTLDAARLLAAEIVSLTQTSEVRWSPESNVTGLAPLPVDFDHTLEFLGYRVERARRQAGKDVRLLAYWRILKSPPLFLTGFVHLLSDPYHVIAQNDRQALLTDLLQPGDVFIQVHTLTIPPGTPPGAYRLSIGWFVDLPSRRLTVYDGQAPRGDRLMLQEITVRP